MKLISKSFTGGDRVSVYNLYVLGDPHIGARGCAEKQLKHQIKEIQKDPTAFWIGGGDYLESIKPQDSKRFDMDCLADWMLEGKAVTIRERLNDILAQQFERACDILEPIADKCLGLIEGNHEFSIRKYYNTDVMKGFCNRLGVVNLTDEAVIRLMFETKAGTKTSVQVYICHGHGGGRTAGAEPNHLARMLNEWETADICFRGHSHTFHIIPPKPVLEFPKRGAVPDELITRYRWAANWGCWLYSHPSGPSSYASRACYPARPMLTAKAVIKPFARVYHKHKKDFTRPHIEIRSITL